VINQARHYRGPLRRGGKVAATLLLAVVVLGGTAFAAQLQQTVTVGVVAVVAILVAAGAWSWHRVAPVTSAVVVVATVAAYVLAGEPFGPIQIVVSLACFAVARYRCARTAALLCAAAALTLAGALWTRLDASHLAATAAILLAWPGVFVIVPALAGALVRTRVEAAARERVELMARGAYEERLRVAREVHDIAGHGFAVVAMQAGVALTVFDEQPRQARISLEAIRTSSEHALRELQAGLDTLQNDAPTAHGVPGLVERVRAGGLPVELTIRGAPRILEPQVSVLVYRLVQEALTNVVRHAGPTTAEVVIEYGADSVAVSVGDRGSGSGSGAGAAQGINSVPRVARGLGGLRERVEHLQGVFTAADRLGGGFEVAATIPRTGAPR
jgi:signal transduction histidine kinase